MFKDAFDTLYDYGYDALELIKRLGWKLYTGAVVVGIVIGLGLALYPNKPPLPSEIKKQVTSTIFVPKGSGYLVDRQSAKYDPTRQLLSYNVAVGSDVVTVSEQPAPSQFGDITGYYAQFAQGLKTYDDFDSATGHVYLVRLSGPTSQAAVLYGSGTLLFAQPKTPLDGPAWRKFFRNVTVLH